MQNYLYLYEKYKHLACDMNESRTNLNSGSRCCAIYLYNRIPVSIGINKSKTHPILFKLDYHKSNYFSTDNIDKTKSCRKKQPQYPIHAELDGYIKLLHRRLDFNTLLIYRGIECNLPSEPCYVCAKWLKRIDQLIICFINSKNEFESIPSYKLIGHHRGS